MPLKTTSITIKCIVMDFYQVLEKRRTIRDFSDKKVTDEVLEKVLSAAFKAPTNDHLRQFEFIVVRGQENIARLISPVAENTRNIQQTGLEAAAGVMDKDEHAMFVDALPKQQRMLMQSNCLVLPFFRQKDFPLCQPEYVKHLVNAPNGYEFTCFLAIGYTAENAHICKQKEIRVGDRIHKNVW